MSKAAKFPISRQNLYGGQLENPEIFVLVADWTSAEEKDVFEPGPEYQSIKPAFGELVNPENTDFQCHHMILPAAPRTTPEAGFYVVSRMRIPTMHHGAVANAFNKYANSLTDSDGYVFLVAASSREDGEVVVCLTGFRRHEDVARAEQSSAHMELKRELDTYVKEGTRYGGKLTKGFLNDHDNEWERRKTADQR